MIRYHFPLEMGTAPAITYLSNQLVAALTLDHKDYLVTGAPVFSSRFSSAMKFLSCHQKFHAFS